jgi:hypothetical protein
MFSIFTFPVILIPQCQDQLERMGVWQGVAMDSLKFNRGLPCSTLLCPAGGQALKRPYPQGGQPAAVVDPFGRPTPFAYGQDQRKRH